MTTSEQPSLKPPVRLTFLAASPFLRGSFFGDALILLLEHDQSGAVGLVVNAPLDTPIADLLPDDAPGVTECAWLGGPVEPGVGWCLYQQPVGGPGELRLTAGLMATTHLQTFAQVRASGQRYMLLLGYAGWSAGQLEDEARDGAWLWLEEDGPELLWNVDAPDRWQAALDRLGVDPASVVSGGAQA